MKGSEAVSRHEISLEPQYRLAEIGQRNTYLRPVFEAFDVEHVRAWTDAPVHDGRLSRTANAGLVTALAYCRGGDVAVVWSDFRVEGASYGRANSRRLVAFLRYLRGLEERIPLVYVVNSAGVSLMEGRTAFGAAFGIWPELLEYSQERTVLTCAAGQCLGLAPLLFGLGHYRVAVAGETRINLTGPQVMKLFFGRGCEFDRRTSAERCIELHDLVHEILPTTVVALRRLRQVIELGRGCIGPTLDPVDLGPRTARLLAPILGDRALELLTDRCPRVRVFLVERRGTAFGLFVNPLDRVDNLISIRTLEKYEAGLDLFRALRLPIVSVLDSPGIDPRFDQTDAGLIRTILSVGERIIRHPHGSLGVVAGRCFGGATTLVFPRVFGGDRTIALREAQIGMMDGRIVEQVLQGSPRLLGRWRQAKAKEDAQFSDLVDVGSLDRVIESADLPFEVDTFLTSHSAPVDALPLRRVVGR